MKELYSFVQGCAKFHSMEYKEYCNVQDLTKIYALM